MKWLAIETSCDETACAIVEDGCLVHASIVASQIQNHAGFGGVVPELAARMHTETINAVIDQTLKTASMSLQDIEGVAVTQGPGLEGCLLIGLTAGKVLSATLTIPFVGVHHHLGHLYSCFLTEHPPSFPFLALIVSGGHTQLVEMKAHLRCTVLAKTRDDAAGEAFDKVARILGLGYPGGPEIEEVAKQGNCEAFSFPRAMKHDDTAFSFSGLKTAVMQTVKTLSSPLPAADLCASFQQAVFDSLIQKTLSTAKKKNLSCVGLCGGVSANQTLAHQLEQACHKEGIRLVVPPKQYCTDNAAMIGVAGHFIYTLQGQTPLTCEVKPRLELTI